MQIDKDQITNRMEAVEAEVSFARKKPECQSRWVEARDWHLGAYIQLERCRKEEREAVVYSEALCLVELLILYFALGQHDIYAAGQSTPDLSGNLPRDNAKRAWPTRWCAEMRSRMAQEEVRERDSNAVAVRVWLFAQQRLLSLQPVWPLGVNR